ncbi:hypothetical protein T07_14677 [Trichinella nelsoni]|uniref:Uncharacterized protein n=1 Tax=Trichinella nelsoni TaxID=6336 RepID=A0A0V0RBI4_9BILA|nr:hypothetical protein T07_14677 [Trichinella nelsoni]
MDKPGCDICDHAKGSHRKLPTDEVHDVQPPVKAIRKTA